MDGTSLIAAGWLTMAAVTGVGGDTHGQAIEQAGGDRLELTLAVYSEAEVAWVSSARAIVAGLFEDAGIHLAWVSCDADSPYPACKRPPNGNELVVRLRRKRADRESHTCGIALRPDYAMGSYITLFLDCIAEGSEAFRIQESVVAAYCLAHEIAHLLLPTSAHSASGIMQPGLRPIDWERAASGGLRFHLAERRRMAEALRRRAAAAR